MIDFTHMVFGLALGYVLRFPVVWAMLGSVAPDIDILFDYGFPFTHRGVLHTPLFVGFAMAALYLATRRTAVAAGAGLGLLSHLFLDTFTYSGIMWLYPVTTEYSLMLVGYDSLVVNYGAVALATLVAVGWRYQAEVVRWLR